MGISSSCMRMDWELLPLGKFKKNGTGKVIENLYTISLGQSFLKVANEYRIEVKWFLDISDSPLSVKELKDRIGYIPRGAVTPFIKWRHEIEKIINELKTRNLELIIQMLLMILNLIKWNLNHSIRLNRSQLLKAELAKVYFEISLSKSGVAVL